MPPPAPPRALAASIPTPSRGASSAPARSPSAMRTTAPSPSPSTASAAPSPPRASPSEEGAAAAARLSVAIVTYRCDTALLERALRSLARAAAHARRDGCLRGDVALHVIDNGPQASRPALER